MNLIEITKGCESKQNEQTEQMKSLPDITDKWKQLAKEDVFKKMDAIANAVSDSCEPAIIPDITLQTVDGKTVINQSMNMMTRMRWKRMKMDPKIQSQKNGK